jgi:glutamate 5-kinase
VATLLTLRAVPVINENDTVATSEIRFGDNDRLAARVAAMIAADALVLLSDIDGLYSADPKLDPTARHIPLIEDLSPEIEAMGGEALPGYSSGGMVTKLAAARIAIGAGCRMAIADGLRLILRPWPGCALQLVHPRRLALTARRNGSPAPSPWVACPSTTAH